MNKLFYPAIFHITEEGGFWITFPDLPECMTQGDDMQHAYEMAVDALGLVISSPFRLNLIKLLRLQVNTALLLNLICLHTRNALIPKQSKKHLQSLSG